ncbi:4-hydroxy-tetrahydrodipicolinate synthase [Aliiglaciecola sp. CAU 1673]|uniref:4-hydroxy-tetrahydrodipicolinate synthase n=1 Tax=Aliiglaciecola sp. CAU 1673 TaxID=3032595 RepID=UPI0023D9DA84|nr:4-hydroxy-tetrahydrodipicolinate synthase [Aliiglaciecola sp. CAU 1673]MDF2177554.1 4-hydroxy-tetrahydrodipicolinate synthase [Aliiglaciecola sp. CAU 1673]
MFKGSVVALVTPMADNGQVDYETLKNLVEFHINAGTDGVVAVGTTGEASTLPFDEHIKVVAKIVEYSDRRVPVIAGTGANSTSEAIELSQASAGVGVDGVLSVVPYYNKPQQRGLVAHFNAVADATDLPVLLYNVPGRTVTDLLPDTVVELAKHPQIIGLKEATGDLKRLQVLKSKLSDDFILLSGDDPTACEFMLQGGHGVISVTANIVPAIMAKLCQLATSGKAEEARALDATIAALHHALFIEPNPVMPKWALYKMGLMPSPALRLPLVLPEQIHQNAIEQVMKNIGVLS